MGFASRSGVKAFGFVLATVVALGATSLAAEESTAEKPADAPKPAAEKKVVDRSRHVPPFFGQVGLTADQKEAIYKIRAKRQSEIDSLHEQLVRLQSAMLADCEAVLSDSQKQVLSTRREAAARARAAKAAAPESTVQSKPAS